MTPTVRRKARKQFRKRLFQREYLSSSQSKKWRKEAGKLIARKVQLMIDRRNNSNEKQKFHTAWKEENTKGRSVKTEHENIKYIDIWHEINSSYLHFAKRIPVLYIYVTIIQFSLVCNHFQVL